MMPEHFDEMSRILASGLPRRQVLKALVVASAGGLFGVAAAPRTAHALPACAMGTVTVWVNAFIPGDLPGLTVPVPGGPHAGRTMIPGPVPGVSDCFLTDGGGFDSGQGSSCADHPPSRVACIARIDVARGRLLEQHCFCCETVEVDCEDGDVEDVCVAPIKGPQFHNLFVGSVTPKLITIDLAASGENPCFRSTPGALVPDINVEGTFEIRLHNAGDASVRFNGRVDLFPAFEIYARADDGPAVALLQRFPDPGTSPASLLTSNLEIPVDAEVRLRASGACPQGSPVCCESGACCQSGHICTPGHPDQAPCCPPDAPVSCPPHLAGGCCPSRAPLCCAHGGCCPTSHPICNVINGQPMCSRPRVPRAAGTHAQTGPEQVSATPQVGDQGAARITASAHGGSRDAVAALPRGRTAEQGGRRRHDHQETRS